MIKAKKEAPSIAVLYGATKFNSCDYDTSALNDNQEFSILSSRKLMEA